MSKRESIQSILLYIVFIIYILFLLKLLLLSRVSLGELSNGERSLSREFNFVPFRGVIEYMFGDEADVRKFAFSNVVGNIGIFIPMGVYISLFRNDKRVIPALWFIFVISLLVEVIQGILAIGTADVDDIILNSLGGWIGILGYKFLLLTFRDEEKVRNAVTILSVLGLPVLLYLIFMVRLRL